jgi:uncharacterized membrane protein YfhO
MNLKTGKPGKSSQKPAGSQSKDPIEKPISIGFFILNKKTSFFIASGIISLVALIIFRDFLLFHKLFLYKDIGSDSVNESLPFITHSAHYLKNYGIFSWSFNIGMGADITPVACDDPFNLFLYTARETDIAWLMGYKECIKVVLAGIVFYKYLETNGRSFYSSLIGALMFAFCGFIMVSSAWGFSSHALIASLILLGFERLFLLNKPLIIVTAFLLIGISGPFYIALYALFLMFYSIFRYLGENRSGIRGFARICLKMMGLAFLGICISAPVLIAQLKMMLESPRVSGGDSMISKLMSAPIFDLIDQKQLGTAIHRFFATEILGSGDDYKGWGNILEGPAFYCGIPCLMLVPALFGFLDQKRIKIFSIFLAVWILPVLFPWFRHAIWLFAGDYYRLYSLFVALVFIIYSTICIDFIVQGKKLNIKIFVITALVLIFVQKLSFFENKNVVNEHLETAVDLFILAYAGLIFWISKHRNKAIPMILFLLVFCGELCWFSYLSVSRDSNITASEMKQRIGYNDYSNEAIAWLKNRDQSFFRIDKTYGSSLARYSSYNDAMMQNYYGTNCYSSFNQKYYLQYLRAYNIINDTVETESRWSIGLVNRPFLQNLNAVKYILIRGYKNRLKDPVRDSLTTFDNISILKNKFALPLGYCYRQYVKFSEFEKMQVFQKDAVGLKAAVINDADTEMLHGLPKMSLKDTFGVQDFSTTVLKNFTDSLKEDTLAITSFKPSKISGHIQLKSDKLLYLSIPYDKGWQITTDGKERHILLIGNGMMGVMMEKGKHAVELRYKPMYRTEGCIFSLISLMILGGVLYSRKKKEG